MLSCGLLVTTSCSSEPGKSSKTSTDYGPLPDRSIYHVEASFTNQRGDNMKLRSLRGKPVVAAMIFTNCQFACPAITQDIKDIQERLPAGQAEDVHFVLISFDTKRDTADALADFAQKMELDNRWMLLHGSESDVRQISMLLDVSYKDVGGGVFSHDNVIHLLNSDGEILARSEGLGNNNKDIIKKIQTL